jgi:hypothetical protein
LRRERCEDASATRRREIDAVPAKARRSHAARDLRAHRVGREVNGKWYIAPTGARFDERAQWSKPYATLQRATTAIARKLADEVIKRHKRRCDFYGIMTDADLQGPASAGPLSILDR